MIQRAKTNGNGKNAQRVSSTRVAPPYRSMRLVKSLHEDYVLPASYGMTRLALLARDPFWVHAYWEISQESWNTLQRELGGSFDHAALCLRMYDVTLIDFNGFNANHWFDIDVNRGADNWYLNLWTDNISYCAELGMRAPDGRFVPIARSNTVTTPRQSYSDRADMIWMEMDEDEEPRAFVNLGEQILQRNRKTARKNPAAFRQGRWRQPLSPEEIKAYYARIFPLLRILKFRRRRLQGKGALLGIEDLDMEQSIIPGLLPEEYYKRISIGPSGEMFIKELGGASENLSSHVAASQQEEKKRKFFFELWTECIVHGRTEPDAKVFRGAEKVTLRPDGTFTMRFALPDGKIPLDFLAVSHDDVEQRRITTAIERTRTIYAP